MSITPQAQEPKSDEQLIRELQSTIRNQKYALDNKEVVLGRMQNCINTAYQLVTLAISHNYEDEEMSGELNLIAYWLKREVVDPSDSDIPF